MKTQEVYVAYNQVSRKYEAVDLDGEFSVGDRVIKMFYVKSTKKYSTITGVPAMVMTASGWAEEIESDEY